jgi:hypothetical protein
VNPFVQMAVKEMREGIVHLDLSSCGLSSLYAGILAAELKENANLKHFILGRNPIGPAGVEAIAKACQGNTSLASLHFSFAAMGSSVGQNPSHETIIHPYSEANG